MEADEINVSSIIPEIKDWTRMEGMKYQRGKRNPDGSPWASNASKMARLITNPTKLVRRAKAVAATYGIPSVAWTPFQEALESMGFTTSQIVTISHYQQ